MFESAGNHSDELANFQKHLTDVNFVGIVRTRFHCAVIISSRPVVVHSEIGADELESDSLGSVGTVHVSELGQRDQY